MKPYAREDQLRHLQWMAARMDNDAYEEVQCGEHGLAARTQWAPDFPCRREHVLSTDCWCKPRVDSYGNGAAVP